MAIDSLDHVNIRSSCMAATLDFYGNVLGMTVEAAPGSPAPMAGAWILAGDGRPAVHVGPSEGPDFLGQDVDWTDVSGSARVHHVAFNGSDHDAMRQRLEAAGLHPRYNDIPAVGLRQIFIEDPNGILLEFNFR